MVNGPSGTSPWPADVEDVVTNRQWVFAVALLPLLYVVAELVARWWIRRRDRYYVLPPGLRLRLEIDREIFPQLERETRFDVNGQGERGDEVPRTTDGLYRVLVAGGSQPEGFLLDQDTAWPGAVQRLLERPGALSTLGASRVHVGCIARSGVGSEALDLLFDRVLPRYPRLQLIIVMIGATDVMRWLEYGASRSLPPVRIPDIFRCHPEGPFGWKPKDLAAWELLLRARRRWLRPVVVHQRAGRWYAQARAMRARASEIRRVMPEPGPMLEQFELHFRRALEKAAAHADRVLVVRQPWFDKDYSDEEAAHMWHGGAGQAWREEVTTYYSFEVVSRLMACVDERAAAVATALGVEQLDLMPILERSLGTYYDGFHATPAGARTVATATAAAILRQPLPAVMAAAPRADAFAGNRRPECVDLLAS
jgi:lysophospholipase L1-like esterase